ncbi:VOC family protein [Aliiroseovarius sp. S2029]|uniref:VOC family protein n=1 Tax=Aliiroseovarius sp. S2029 TaxID=2936988 RepID=UPI0020C0D787|nr:VOC family protein [Aliiroseovarius sp. S2029]MCK8484638.1 VOC family protein [Aliiroseovarius sp. S2029]
MTVTGVNHITLAVTDLPRAITFYTDLLGGRLRAEWDSGAYLELGALWLCLTLSAHPIAPRTDYSHIALSCIPADFPALVTRIQQTAQLWQDNTSEGASVYFLDPDGHKLELHQGTLDTRLEHYRAHPEKPVRLYD